jgi:flagellar motility protein MotE (MotC chaperone)
MTQTPKTRSEVAAAAARAAFSQIKAPPSQPAPPPAAPAPPRPAPTLGPEPRRFTPRIIPALIFVGVVMLGVRVKDVWMAVETGVASRPADAQAPQPAATPTGTPLPGMTPGAAAPAPGVTSVPVQQANAPPAFPPAPVPPPGARDGAPIPAERFGDAEQELLQRLAERRAELNRRAQDLDQRAALLTAAEQRVNQKLVELEDLRNQIKSLVRQVDQEQRQQIESLVKLYETMRPADAARIMGTLDMGVLIEVVSRMRESKAAPILAAMDASKARELTIQLAERRQIPPVPIQ